MKMCKWVITGQHPTLGLVRYVTAVTCYKDGAIDGFNEAYPGYVILTVEPW